MDILQQGSAEMIISKLVCMISIAFSVCACASTPESDLPPPPPQPVLELPEARSLDSGRILERAQLAEAKSMAEAGDGSAALRLYHHFNSVKNELQASYWLLLAGARGNPTAQYNLWFSLKDREDCRSRLEALAWIRSAALSGDNLSEEQFNRFSEVAKPCIHK